MRMSLFSRPVFTRSFFTMQLLVLLVVAWLAGVAGQVRAERAQVFDHYEVHYNALNSSFLPPEVAMAYDIRRSDYRALLNVAVLDADRGLRPAPGRVEGTLTNLLGQKQALEFREIREGNAIYYLADFPFTNEENLTFNLEVTPDSAGETYSFSFSQKFYAD